MIKLLKELSRRRIPASRLGVFLLVAVLPACAAVVDMLPDTAAPVATSEPPLRASAKPAPSTAPVALMSGSTAERAVSKPEIVMGTGTFVNPEAASGYRAEAAVTG